MSTMRLPTDEALAKAKEDERKAKDAALAQQRRLAHKARKVQAMEEAQRQARLMQLGTLVETAGFTMADAAFLTQALAHLRVMQDDPERWEILQGELVEATGVHP